MLDPLVPKLNVQKHKTQQVFLVNKIYEVGSLVIRVFRRSLPVSETKKLLLPYKKDLKQCFTLAQQNSLSSPWFLRLNLVILEKTQELTSKPKDLPLTQLSVIGFKDQAHWVLLQTALPKPYSPKQCNWNRVYKAMMMYSSSLCLSYFNLGLRNPLLNR